MVIDFSVASSLIKSISFALILIWWDSTRFFASSVIDQIDLSTPPLLLEDLVLYATLLISYIKLIAH